MAKPKPPKLTQAPPPFTPLSGAGPSGFLDDKSRSALDPLDGRQADWTVWRQIPEVTIREAIYLSLDIDPRSTERGYVDATFGDKPSEFETRLFIACRGDREKLPRTAMSLIGPEESKVSLTQFAAWAQSIPWEIPNELAALAANYSDSKLTPTPQPEQAQNRRDILYPAFDKAIAETDGSVAAVYVYLREMALAQVAPFTSVDNTDGALLYTDANNSCAKLTRDAISKRLKRRR